MTGGGEAPGARGPTADAGPAPDADPGGGVTLLDAAAGKRRDEVNISRGTIYGSPFIAREAAEAVVVQAAYKELLRGASAPRRIGKAAGGGTSRGGTLRIHEASERTPAHARLRALAGLVQRAIRGERLYLRCNSCVGSCHGEVIQAWVEERMRPVVPQRD